MSVTTTSDEHRIESREKIKQAAKLIREAQELLSTAIDPDTWGSTEYNAEYSITLQSSEVELLQISRSLVKIQNQI